MSEVTSESAEAFRFSLQQFVRQEVLLDRGGVQLADGGWLVPSNDVTAGKQEFYRYSESLVEDLVGSSCLNWNLIVITEVLLGKFYFYRSGSGTHTC